MKIYVEIQFLFLFQFKFIQVEVIKLDKGVIESKLGILRDKEDDIVQFLQSFHEKEKPNKSNPLWKEMDHLNFEFCRLFGFTVFVAFPDLPFIFLIEMYDNLLLAYYAFKNALK